MNSEEFEAARRVHQEEVEWARVEHARSAALWPPQTVRNSLARQRALVIGHESRTLASDCTGERQRHIVLALHSAETAVLIEGDRLGFFADCAPSRSDVMLRVTRVS
jgi:hypothetical protein